MSTGLVFLLIFMLFVKHIIIDFPIYSGYLCRRYPAAFSKLWYAHIVMHGIGSFAIFSILMIPFHLALLIALLDLVWHFIIDTVTTYAGNRNQTDPIFESNFYWVPELDQFLHCLTYIVMVLLLSIFIL